MPNLILPVIPNLSSFEVTLIELNTRFEDKRPYRGDPKSKQAFTKWSTDTDTKWTFFSGFTSLDPHTRASRENQPYTMHAFIADYDFRGDDGFAETVLKQHSENGGITPNAISKTFSSGLRAVWAFEKPVTVFTRDIAQEFVQELAKYTRAKMLYPGLDERALADVHKYFELGTDWTEYEDIPVIKEDTLLRLLAEACKRAKHYHLREEGLPKIPLDLVYEEVVAKFPGRWQGEFVHNARGTRFWDPEADALSAIVKPEGMLCYTGEKKFVSWSEIFGRAFVDKFMDDKMGAILKGVYTDGKMFFIKSPTTEDYQDLTTEQMRWKLQADHGLQDGKDQNLVLNKILELNRVVCAVPVVHRPEGLIVVNSGRVLNTWKNNTMRMSEEERVIDPKADFPFLYKLWFEDGFNPHEQLDYFLAWLRRWYESAIMLKPNRGQVLVIAGQASAGKTFTSQFILGSIFGGFQDASKFFTENSNFNGHMFSVPLWCVDDAMVSTNEARQLLYSAMLKKIAADSKFEFSEKYRKGGMVEWGGRVVVTCNDDPESLSAVPQLTVSNDDKVMLLKMSGNAGKFKNVNPEDEVKKELPLFLRWLMKDWIMPAHVKNDNPRYGVVPYKHAEVYNDAMHANDLHGLEELLSVYWKGWFSATDGKETKVDCMTSELLERLQGEGSPVSRAAKSLNMWRLGRELKKYSNKRDAKTQTVIIDGVRLHRFKKEDFL